jgi:hypothetical protein
MTNGRNAFIALLGIGALLTLTAAPTRAINFDDPDSTEAHVFYDRVNDLIRQGNEAGAIARSNAAMAPVRQKVYAERLARTALNSLMSRQPAIEKPTLSGWLAGLESAGIGVNVEGLFIGKDLLVPIKALEESNFVVSKSLQGELLVYSKTPSGEYEALDSEQSVKQPVKATVKVLLEKNP